MDGSLTESRHACSEVSFAPFALLFVFGLPFAANAADDPSAIGVVDRVENEAKVVSGETVTPAMIGTPVHLRDELRTGAEGRLRVTFRDDTVLTLGEKASVVIDRYVYDPDRNVGETVLQATKGAFRFASGRIKGLKQNNIAVSTPVADIGVRGTAVLGRTARQIWGAGARGRDDRVQSGRQRDAFRRRGRAPTSPRRSIRRARSSPGAKRRSPAPSRRWPCISDSTAILAKPCTKRRTLKIRHLAGAGRLFRLPPRLREKDLPLHYRDGIIEAIGNTPLIKLKRASEETGCTILGKAEFMNPGQSVKDRAALFIIRDALNSGRLQPGGTVVEGTAGNTGIGLRSSAMRSG